MPTRRPSPLAAALLLTLLPAAGSGCARPAAEGRGAGTPAPAPPPTVVPALVPALVPASPASTSSTSSTSRSPSPASSPGDGLEVEVRGLETEGDSPVVLLGPADGSLVVPIWIGPAEALAIAIQLSGVTPPRPMTHDLVRSLLAATRADLEKVTVTELRAQTFYARLSLRVGGETVELDSRPSDAIALAMRMKAPILVSAQVLAEAGIRRSEESVPAAEPVLGLKVQPLTPALARLFRLPHARCVLVADVEPGGRAAAAGVRAGDVVLAVSAHEVASPGAFAQAVAAGGDRIALTVLRGGAELRISVPRGAGTP